MNCEVALVLEETDPKKLSIITTSDVFGNED
jgi:hypothetical protein